MYEEFDHDTHWVSEQIESGLFTIENPILVSILKFTTPWNILAFVYTYLQWDSISISFIYASAFGLLWVNLAPFLIWYYDERVLPGFFAHISELISDPEKRHYLAEKYNTLFAKHRISVSLFWSGALISIVFASESVLQTQGMTNSGELFLWTTYAYAAYIGGVLSHGFVGPVTTILLIREVSEYELEIDPLHPDNLGGLSTVGYISIRTTLLYSSASLFLPLLFYFSSSGGDSLVIFLFSGIYVVSIFTSFIYPTAIINRRAQKYRDSVLEDLRRQYKKIEQSIEEPDKREIGELNKRLELQRIQKRYEKYNSVNLYPFQLSILAQLAGSVILPIVFMLIELYLPDLL